MESNRIFPQEVERVLRQLRLQIRLYVLFRGIGTVLSLACLWVWCSLIADWGFFQLERADLPSDVRRLIWLAAAAGGGWAIWNWIISGLRYALTPTSLGLLIERRYPLLDGRLLTVVQRPDDRASESNLTHEMRERIVPELEELLKSFSTRAVFDSKSLRKSAIRGSLGLAITCGLFVYFPETTQLWFRRNVLLREAHWPRRTHYHLFGKVPPHDRRSEIQSRDLYHPRGSDLTLSVEFEQGSLIPERIELRTREAGSGATTRTYFSRQGGDRFHHTLSGVAEEVFFQIRAGDAQREWYRIIPVAPPRIERMTCYPGYPEYTGLQADGEADPLPVIDSRLKLPEGTLMELEVVCNKPMNTVRVSSDRFEIEMRSDRTLISHVAPESSGETANQPFTSEEESRLASDGRSIRIPLLIDSKGVGSRGSSNALQIIGNETIEFSLLDSQGISNSEPLRLTLDRIDDKPPQVETRLDGVGTSITRKARIPIVGRIADDYGVKSGYFEFRRAKGEEPEKADFARSPSGEREFRLSRSPNQMWEEFDVLPLELTVGGTLELGVCSEDGDILTGPHRTSGEKYQFQIVSDDSLLSILRSREMNLRQRFEQILAETRRMLEELKALEKKLDSNIPDQADARGAVSRSLLGLRKNHNESDSVEAGFDEIRRETLNNRVETPQSLERLEFKLISPLHRLNQAVYNGVDSALVELQSQLDHQTRPADAIPQSIERTGNMIATMEAILKEMKRMESYTELVELLKSIKSEQEQMKRFTEQERKRQAIEGLK